MTGRRRRLMIMMFFFLGVRGGEFDASVGGEGFSWGEISWMASLLVSEAVRGSGEGMAKSPSSSEGKPHSQFSMASSPHKRSFSEADSKDEISIRRHSARRLSEALRFSALFRPTRVRWVTLTGESNQDRLPGTKVQVRGSRMGGGGPEGAPVAGSW